MPQNLLPAVYIIGAGPGDPELLTLKAHRILTQADVVLYANSLVPTQILQDVRSQAELIPTGSKTLEEIVPLMGDRVRENKIVVRLHSGDLSLYSAIHEQIQALIAQDIPFELIPGISAYQDAAAKLGVELTIPGLVQSIILTRASGRASAVPDAESLETLAAHQASLCLYLSARHVEAAQAQLLQHYPSTTPVGVCYRLGWPDEQIWVVSLDKMTEITQTHQLIRTTLYLISPTLDASKINYQKARSRLYHPDHSHLFRPDSQSVKKS